MHFATGAVNKLTQETFDPQAGIPEYEISSVRLESLGSAADEEGSKMPDVSGGTDPNVVGDG